MECNIKREENQILHLKQPMAMSVSQLTVTNSILII